MSSNKTFSAWAEIFGDPVVAAAIVDRLVHHAEVIVLKSESYRLRGKREEVLSGAKEHRRVYRFRAALSVQVSGDVDTALPDQGRPTPSLVVDVFDRAAPLFPSEGRQPGGCV